MKYNLITVSGIHIKIGLNTDTEGYSIGVLDSILPTDEEMENWSDKKVNKWIRSNNQRMESICDFLNSQV